MFLKTVVLSSSCVMWKLLLWFCIFWWVNFFFFGFVKKNWKLFRMGIRQNKSIEWEYSVAEKFLSVSFCSTLPKLIPISTVRKSKLLRIVAAVTEKYLLSTISVACLAQFARNSSKIFLNQQRSISRFSSRSICKSRDVFFRIFF